MTEYFFLWLFTHNCDIRITLRILYNIKYFLILKSSEGFNKYSDELDKDDEEPNATEDSIERQIQQVIEKGIEDDEKEKSSQDDDRKSDSKSQKSDTSDDEMERLRKEALSKFKNDLRV